MSPDTQAQQPPAYPNKEKADSHSTLTSTATFDSHSGQDIESQNEKTRRKKAPLTERNCCVRCMCCACCLPVWARWLVWFIIIGIIICVVVIGSLLGSFKMPTLDFAGITSSPDASLSQVSYNGSTFTINIGLLVHIQNPNVLPIYLSDVNAVATYPISDDGSKRTTLGTGHIDRMTVPKNSNYNFTFPFAIDYNPMNTNDQLLLNSLLEKCGLTGKEAEDISVDYTVKVKARVLFVTVHLTIANSATFGCPLQEILSSPDEDNDDESD